MISTYLGYTIASRDMTTTLGNIAAQSETKRQADYYNANIGKVKTVDDLLGNYQLYSYAMKAYGLEDMTYAKGMMKEVLTSDLSDSSSFANKLTDPRYKAFAAAFNFGATTDVPQTSDQEDDMLGLYTQSFTDEETAAKTASDAYAAGMDTITNVDQLLSNTKLRSYVLSAYGLDPTVTSNSFLKSVLTSDLSDPNSFVNLNGSATDKKIAAQFNFNTDGTVKTSTPDADIAYYQSQISSITSVKDLTSNTQLFDYIKTAYGISNISAAAFNASARSPSLAASNGLTDVMAQFNFQPDGTVASGDVAQNATQLATGAADYTANFVSHAQTETQKAAVMDQYNTTVPSFMTAVGAADSDAYYKATIGSITSITDLTSDTQLFNYVKTAYGLDSNMSATEFRLGMRNSTNAALFGLSNVITQFNFQSDGTVASGDQAQTSTEIAAASTAFKTNYAKAQTALVTSAQTNYKTRIADVTDIKSFFLSNADADTDKSNDSLPELYQVALRAYGISPDEMSTTQMKKVLESDPYDPKSYVSSLKDARFTNLAKAFNFGSDGKLETAVQALSQADINNYVNEYTSRSKIGLTGAALTKATTDIKTAATYFATNITGVHSVTDLLADTKLTNFILTASGIDPKKVTTDTLKKAFAADPSDPKSFVNTDAGAQFKNIVEAFNFDAKGNLTNTKLGTAQNAGAVANTDDLYLHQTLESQQGETSDGVRLALYFQRKAPDISSIYDIMSDSALYQVITTTFSLPSSISNMDVDQQAKMLNNLVDISDLQDPDKVTKLLQRFSAMYDLQNTSTSSPALSILQGSGTVGISADMLLSIATLKTS
ncbi:DUF1217 domain-containing protein [Rhizobium tubonense]|uniref:Flagellar biosynthesis protein FlgF n=1 Tax=Rhizobium tubonense TaxID=484088 RepID=A0A2W4CEL9_9HYPH|nr:DUF1217 domain-containing protein [Rhizobium tubonense]PZM09195.1 flagellar biosynthesis protein FlgF [Rhizobium tubonense]